VAAGGATRVVALTEIAGAIAETVAARRPGVTPARASRRVARVEAP
jgi:hypothetical protein